MLARTHKTVASALQMALFANNGEMLTQPLKIVSVKQRAPKFNVRLLQLPLFNLDIEPETAVADFVELKTIGYIPETEEQTEPAHQWSSDGVADLHSVLLYESLSALAGRGNGQQKQEILEWIFEPDYAGEVIKNGVPTHIYNWEIPWTFLFCCRLERMHDPEIIRDFIRSILPEGAAMFFK